MIAIDELTLGLERLSAILWHNASYCVVDGTRIKGAALSAVINRQINDDNRDEMIGRLASAAGISRSTVNNILSGNINCPPRNRLQGFARVLGVSVESLITAAERDGCDYGEEDE